METSTMKPCLCWTYVSDMRILNVFYVFFKIKLTSVCRICVGIAVACTIANKNEEGNGP